VRYECNVAYRRQLLAFCSLLLKLKQIHNLKNRVFPHAISDYKEKPRPTFFVNLLENSTIMKLHQIINCLFAKNVTIPNKIVYKPRWEGVSFLSRALLHLGYALVNYLSSRQE
jgi:hypothetical protein